MKKVLSGTVFVICLYLISAAGLPRAACAFDTSRQPAAAAKVTAYDSDKALNGYTLFSARDRKYNETVTLMDMEGNVIKQWENLINFPVKFLPNGSVMGIQEIDGKVANWEFDKLAQLSWEGVEEWSYAAWEEDLNGQMSARIHHDFQREGNPVGYYAPGMEPLVTGGKTLILSFTDEQDSKISDKPLLDPVIYEVDWAGKLTGFEWHGKDHFDEYGFDQKAKDAIYSKGGEWLYMNSMSLLGPNRLYDDGDERFNPENIIICSRLANFIAIISRATGEIVWKVGPDYSPETAEGENLGQIIGPHHAHMIPRGLPGEGNIILLDNGGFAGYPMHMRFYSRVIEFDPLTLEKKWEYKQKWGRDRFYTPFTGSVQRLPNGNTMVDEGYFGRIFELTPANEIVWEYEAGRGMTTYRAYRVPPEWVPGNPVGYDAWTKP